MGDGARAASRKMKRLWLLLAVLCFLLLAAFSPPYVRKEVSVFLDGEELPGEALRVEATHALRAKRAGGYEKLYDRLLKDYSPKEALNYLAVGLGDYLSAECEKRKVDPLDATLEWTKNLSDPFVYFADRPGREADLAEIGRLVARAMDNDNARALARTHEVAAAVTLEDLKRTTKEMARFSTSFATSGENRRHNLALAASAIAGTVVAPGESFSFNQTVGERTAERGFKEANVVVNGEFQKGIGGGVCQVSTTLYNAVLLAALPVENAAAHSIPVSYVPISRDCTVSAAIDFVFRNDTAHPLYVAAEVKGSSLTFALFGEERGEPCHLESEVTERLPYRNLYEDGSEAIADGVLLSPGREGIKSRLYLIRGATRRLIRENYYAKKDAVYKKAA